MPRILRCLLFMQFVVYALTFQSLSFGRENSVNGLSAKQIASLEICDNKVSICSFGQRVQLRGVNLLTAFFLATKWEWATIDSIAAELALVKRWGGNFVIIGFDPSRTRDSEYVNKIVQIVEHAKANGFFVQLNQHHVMLDASVESPEKKLTVEVPIIERNGEVGWNISDSWRQFLSHHNVASRLAASVDIFGVLSEPGEVIRGTENADRKRKGAHLISWRDWKPIAENVCEMIRKNIMRVAMCSISGANYAWDISGLRFEPFRLSNVIAEVHQYKWRDDRGDTWDKAIKPLIGKVPILVGEIGYRDNSEYINRSLEVIELNGISWAAWPGPDRSWVDNYYKHKTGVSVLVMDALRRQGRVNK